MRQPRRHKEGQRGATLVEFAIVVPLLLLLLFGIVEFARVITEITTIRTAAREGARFATTVDDSSGAPHYADCAGIIAAANAKTVVGDLESVLVKWTAPDGTMIHSCSDMAISNPDPGAIETGTAIEVEVTSTFDSIVPLLGLFLDGLSLDSAQSRQVFKGVIE